MIHCSQIHTGTLVKESSPRSAPWSSESSQSFALEFDSFDSIPKPTNKMAVVGAPASQARDNRLLSELGVSSSMACILKKRHLHCCHHLGTSRFNKREEMKLFFIDWISIQLVLALSVFDYP